MKSMKKCLVFGLVFFLALGILVACGNDDDPGAEPDVEENGDAEENGDEEEDVVENEFGGETIVLWIDQEGYGEALIDALNEQFPDSTFLLEVVGGSYTVDRLALDGPAGTEGAGDIILFPHDHIARASAQNLLLPLGPDFANTMHGRIPEDSIGTIVSGGNYLGVPLRRESLALFYNADLLAENDLALVSSWEELIEQAADFNDVANGDFLIRWHAGDAFHSHFILTAHGFQLFGPDHNDPDLVNFDTPEAIAGLEFLASLRDILPVAAEDLTWDTVHGAFVAGEVPYIITGPWSISDIRDNGDFEWGITTIPTINGVQPITFGGSHIAAISSHTNYPELARAVLAFMMSDEGLQIMYDHVGALPALMDVSMIDGVTEDPLLLGIEAQANHSHPMPIIPELSHFWASGPDMYTAVWEGLLSPQEAAEHAMAEFEASRALADN
ncbi:MAG: maltose ABC transporter substrate-binding protein [Turicibacter sp.]|nr:maltose ABC transporter substrate-binding protein [Turicibacter sp.]